MTLGGLEPTDTTSRRWATRLLDHERLAGPNDSEAAARVFERVFGTLSPMFGVVGVAALMARAIVRTRAADPSVGGLHIPVHAGEEAIDIIRQHLVALTPPDAIPLAHAIADNLLRLLCTFVGHRLVADLLQRTWPALQFEDPDEK